MPRKKTKAAPAIIKVDAAPVAPTSDSAPAVPKTRMKREMLKRIAALKGSDVRKDGISAECKRAITELIKDGATFSEIADLSGMPSRVAIWDELARDDAWRVEMDKARLAGAMSELDTSHAHLKDAAEKDDIDAIRAAAVYAEQTRAYVEKIAPREFGALVKLAGADGGALTVQVMDYGQSKRLPAHHDEPEAQAEKLSQSRATPIEQG